MYASFCVLTHPGGILLRDPLGRDLSPHRKELDSTISSNITVVSKATLVPSAKREWLSWHSNTDARNIQIKKIIHVNCLRVTQYRGRVKVNMANKSDLLDAAHAGTKALDKVISSGS